MSNAVQKKNIVNDFREFVSEFENESDRAAVVLGTAKLDQTLYQILQTHLIPLSTGKDELLDNGHAISTFSSRINLIYRLGLIDESFARALHLIRKIRNSFAHEVSGCSLSSGSQKDRVKELSRPYKKYKLFTGIHRTFFKSQELDSAIEFRVTLSMILARLEALLDAVEVIEPSIHFKLIPLSWETIEDDSK